MRIYVGSTLSDLAPHRAAVVEALRTLGHEDDSLIEIVSTEDELVDSPPALDDLLARVAKAHLFVLLLGWRYGYIPEDHTKSVVELEYETARQHRRPILCFIADELAHVAGGLVETGENATALRRFKQRVAAENIVRRFVEPADVARQIATAVERWMNRPFSEVGQDIIDRPLLQEEVLTLRAERDRHLQQVEEMRRRFAGIVPAAPIWKGRNFIIDTTLCFCLLPFKDDFFRVYEEGIIAAVEASGLRATHAGQIFDNREIIEDIWESICLARVIIADVTDRNPNVFYELGMCHTLGKEVIVITQNADDVPFDIRHRRYIHYNAGQMASLRSRLQQTIQRVLLRSPSETGA